jgi:hypothetical protein
MIKELPLKGFDATLHNSGNNYPQSNKDVPRLFANFLFVASRNSGKTHTCVSLIKNGYENAKLTDKDGVVHPLRVIVISPTFSMNRIFENLKSLDENDVYEEYSDEIFQNIVDDIERINEEVENFKVYKNAYNLIKATPKRKLLRLIEENPEIVKILEEFNFQNPDDIDIRFKEKPVNFIILDDLMSSSAFSRKAQNLLTYYLIRNRHHFISFWILVQHLKSVPPNIVNNCNVFFLGKFASHKYILDQLYETVSNICTESEFEELYSHSIKEKYGSLIIDTSGDTKRFYKGLDKELVIE